MKYLNLKAMAVNVTIFSWVVLSPTLEAQNTTKYNLIKNFQSSECLADIFLTSNCANNKNKDLSQVWFFEQKEASGKQWAIFNIGKQKCLAANKTGQISMETCNGNLLSQTWYPERVRENEWFLFNLGAQKCLSKKENTTVMDPCDGTKSAQRWSKEPWTVF